MVSAVSALGQNKSKRKLHQEMSEEEALMVDRYP